MATMFEESMQTKIEKVMVRGCFLCGNGVLVIFREQEVGTYSKSQGFSKCEGSEEQYVARCHSCGDITLICEGSEKAD